MIGESIYKPPRGYESGANAMVLYVQNGEEVYHLCAFNEPHASAVKKELLDYLREKVGLMTEGKQ